MENPELNQRFYDLANTHWTLKKKTCSAIFFFDNHLFIYLTDSVFSFWSKPFQLYDMIFIFLVLAAWNVAAVKGNIYIYIYTDSVLEASVEQRGA
jgi:hypothetical protein